MLNGKSGTIAHLDFVGSIIRVRVKIQIVEVEGDVMSSSRVQIPIEIPSLGLNSNVGSEIGPYSLKGLVKSMITSHGIMAQFSTYLASGPRA
jgi:hypothetical protein